MSDSKSIGGDGVGNGALAAFVRVIPTICGEIWDIVEMYSATFSS